MDKDTYLDWIKIYLNTLHPFVENDTSVRKVLVLENYGGPTMVFAGVPCVCKTWDISGWTPRQVTVRIRNTGCDWCSFYLKDANTLRIFYGTLADLGMGTC